MQHTASGANILVVDDDPLILKLVEDGLTKRGYRITTALDGEVGIFLASDMPFDLIVLDATMPGLSGFDVLRHLSADNATAAIPVMMLTSRKQKADVETALALGAKDYLTKPFDIGRLLARVERMLSKFPTSHDLEDERDWDRDRIFRDAVDKGRS